MSSQKKTFANAAKSNSITYPNKNQAIVLETKPQIETTEYIYAIGSLIGPKNITHVSKTYNSKLCIFLVNKDLVEKLVNQYKKIVIQDEEIDIRRYINPAQRIIISHVCPSIPDNVIEDALRYYEVKTVSRITMLRMGIKNDEYAHILSDRRQVFVPPEEVDKIPNSVIVTHEETNYRIFFSPDAVCYKCKKHGHIANTCPEKNEGENSKSEYTVIGTIPQNSTIIEVLDENPKEAQCSSSSVNSVQPLPQNKTQNFKENQLTQNHNPASKSEKTQNSTNTQVFSSKRPAESLSSLEDAEEANNELKKIPITPEKETEENSVNLTPKGKQKSKKPRSESPNNSAYLNEETLAAIKSEMDTNQPMYSVTYETFLKIMEKVKGTTEVLKTVKEYTNDILGFVLTLKELHGFVDDRSTKIKLTKIMHRLREQQQNEEEERVLQTSLLHNNEDGAVTVES